MLIIYCDSVIHRLTVEPDYLNEWNAAQSIGFQTALFSYEDLMDGNIQGALRHVPTFDTPIIGMYRGWMMTPKNYQQLYNGLIKKNIQLINSPEEYNHCHYLPNSFHLIAHQTPDSVWTQPNDPINDKKLTDLLNHFNGAPIIVKDYVKSEKHHWDSACFIPDSSDHKNALKITKRFIELRGEHLNEGIVYRKFEQLEFLTNHTKSGMPLTKEFRIFFFKKQVLCVHNYWSQGNYKNTTPDLTPFLKTAEQIQSNYFTMDIAQKTNGEWIIMELGDGQVSGLPDSLSPSSFYKELNTKH